MCELFVVPDAAPVSALWGRADTALHLQCCCACMMRMYSTHFSVDIGARSRRPQGASHWLI